MKKKKTKFKSEIFKELNKKRAAVQLSIKDKKSNRKSKVARKIKEDDLKDE